PLDGRHANHARVVLPTNWSSSYELHQISQCLRPADPIYLRCCTGASPEKFPLIEPGPPALVNALNGNDFARPTPVFAEKSTVGYSAAPS
ncbi:hypothetical protein, partial [Mycobacterium tuberculosis]|uniref:hypothetical protein n=1 Tax=Mycobacterium tuberculosis TaxID=1773 RepID=UPI001BDBB0BE